MKEPIRLDCEVFAATEQPEAPLRLQPIARARQSPKVVFIVSEYGGKLILSSEPEYYVSEQIELGIFYELPEPVPMKPYHWLLAVVPGQPPEYIHRDLVDKRLKQVGEEALRECNVALREVDISRAREKIGYASLAIPDDPAAAYGRVALWIDDLTDLQLKWEMEPLAKFDPVQARDRVEAAREEGMTELASAILLSGLLSQ